MEIARARDMAAAGRALAQFTDTLRTWTLTALGGPGSCRGEYHTDWHPGARYVTVR